METKRPTIAIFSDPNLVSLKLLEVFLGKIFNVVVFTDDQNSWRKKTQYITNKSNFKILPIKSFLEVGDIYHVVFCYGFNNDNPYSRFEKSYDRDIFSNKKSFFILPFDKFNLNDNQQIDLNSNLGIIYTGDMLGEGFSPNLDLSISKVFKEALEEKTLTAQLGKIYYPTNNTVLAKKISEWIFSFGPFNKETFVVGTQISASELWKYLSKKIQGLQIYTTETKSQFLVPRNIDRVSLGDDLIKTFNITFSGLNMPTDVKVKNIPIPKVKVNMGKLKFPKLKKVWVALSFLVFPYFVFALSSLIIFISYKYALVGKTKTARNLLLLSKTPIVLTKWYTDTLSSIPVVNKFYIDLDLAYTLANHGIEIGVDGLYLIESSKDLLDGVLGEDIYDPSPHTDAITSRVSRINTNYTKMMNDLNSNKFKKTYLKTVFVEKVKTDRLSAILPEAGKLTAQLPEFLGKNGKKTYLILLQNNMELRPTGGFIGSFGLLTFENGRMVDLSVSDVYSADGQLKGHVEPPKPIREYLGEGGWYLRDSNWDPDFTTSAKRAEWFLNKEIDKQVDGVISVDLNPVKDLLTIIGTIHLPDYDMDINANNLYEKTQNEVHEDFFAGTTKKASFLTALSRMLVNSIIESDSYSKTGLLKTVFENVEGRHIQIYLHDSKIQDVISKLNWAGDVYMPKCLANKNCYSDMVGLVEANLGVNKANYFIKRDISVNVKIDKNIIKRQMVVDFKNSANPGLGQAGKYKNYLRIMVPSDAQKIQVFDSSQGLNVPIATDTNEIRGRREIGFLVEVLNGETKSIIVNWESQVGYVLGQPSEYRMYIRKQAGTPNDDKISLTIASSLTKEPSYIYNSDSGEDLDKILRW